MAGCIKPKTFKHSGDWDPDIRQEGLEAID